MSSIFDEEYFPPPKSGFVGGIKGGEYQMQLLELYALRALNNSLEFKLWTEDENLAFKFDDLVMSYKVDNQCKLICAQAKHKDNPVVFQFSTFFTNNNFQLSKYFESFMKILQKLNNDVDAIENLVICTNNKFPCPDGNGSLLRISCSTDQNLQLSFKQQTFQNTFNKEGVLYKFADSETLENCKLLKLYLLSVELVRFLFEKNPDKNANNKILSDNWFTEEINQFYLLPYAKDFLNTHIFDCTPVSIKFKDEFFGSENSDIKFFREIFKQELKSPQDLREKIGDVCSNKNLIDKFNNFKDNEDEINDNIRKFTEKLLFLTDLSENELNQSIKIEILNVVNDLSLLETGHSRFKGTVKSWLFDHHIVTDNNSHEKLGSSRKRNNEIDKIKKEEGKKKLNNSDISQIFENFSEKNILKKYPIEFSTFPDDLRNFFTSPIDRVLIYEVTNGQTLLGSIKLHQLNNKIIFHSTATSNLKFDEVLATVKNGSSENCLVVECENQIDVNVLSEFLQNFQAESNVKLAVVCDNLPKSVKFLECKKFREREMLCDQLTKGSLDRLLMETVKFQGNSVSLSELIDSDCLEKIPLKEFLDSIEGNASCCRSLTDSQPGIYLSRKIRRNVYLKKSILDDWHSNKFKDILVFSESEFFTILPIAQRERKSVHWVEEIENQTRTKLIWKKTYFSIQSLRPYIDGDEYTATTDEEFSSNISQYNIFKDIPGMGKSVFFQHLSQELKVKFKNCWVEKIDVRSYCQEFEEFQEKAVSDDDSEGIKNFFAEQFLKLEFNCLEKEIFANLLLNGRVILLWDGFDELGEEHREILLTIISAFSKISKENKFFISSRPECAQILEDKFSEFSHYFEEFSLEDQLDYLLKLWKKDLSFKEKAKLILQKVNNAITDQERSYTGIPLITKHVATYFEDKLDGEIDLENSHLSIYSLMKHDVRKKIEIFLNEKQGMNKNDKFYKRHFKQLYIGHQKLAQNSFPACKKYFDFFKKIEQDEMEEFIGCGLFQNINGTLVAYHHTIAESLFTTRLEDNINDVKVLEFLFEVALKENGYKLIRSFVNNFIENIRGYQDKEKLTTLIRDNNDVLDVAVEEKNSNSFEILALTLIENQKDFSEFLLKKDKYDYTLLYNFFRNCDVSENFLNELSSKFDLEFIKQILQLENGSDNSTLVIAAAAHGKNCLTLSKWLIQIFSNHFPFIEKIISTKDKWNQNILHNVCYNFNKDNFISLLEVLKNFSDKNETNLLSRLLLEVDKSFNKTFFNNLIYHLEKRNSDSVHESYQILIEILCWIKENSNVFKDIVLKDSILHRIAESLKKCTLNFIKYLCEVENFNPEKVLLCEDRKGRLFTDNIFWNDKNREGFAELMNVLSWVKHENVELLGKILVHEDKNGNDLIRHACNYGQQYDQLQILKSIYEIYESNFDAEWFFKRKNRRGETLLNFMSSNIFDFDSPTVTIKKSLLEISNWIKSISCLIFQEFVYESTNQCIMNKICLYSPRNHLTNKLKSLIEYFEDNIQNFNKVEYLKKQINKWGSFLHSFYKAHDKSETAKVSLELFDWLQSIDTQLFKEIILTKSNDGQTFLHILCKEYRKSDLSNVLQTIFDYLTKNVTDINWNQFVNEKDRRGNTFLNYVRSQIKSEILDSLNRIGIELVLENVN